MINSRVHRDKYTCLLFASLSLFLVQSPCQMNCFPNLMCVTLRMLGVRSLTDVVLMRAITGLIEELGQRRIETCHFPWLLYQSPFGVSQSPKSIHASVKSSKGESKGLKEFVNLWLRPILAESWPLQNNRCSDAFALSSNNLKVVPQTPVQVPMSNHLPDERFRPRI